MIKYNLDTLVTHIHPNKAPSILEHIRDVLDDLYHLSGILFSLESGPWLGGGCLRQAIEGKKCETDFDVFFHDEAQFQQYTAQLTRKLPELSELELNLEKTGAIEKTHDTDHVTNYLVKRNAAKIQLIHGSFYHPDVDTLLNSFDYTICQLVTDGREIVVGPYTLIDIHNKKLTVHRLTYPAASLSRAVKYGSYGYKMCNGEVLKFLNTVVERPSLLETRFAYID